MCEVSACRSSPLAEALLRDIILIVPGWPLSLTVRVTVLLRTVIKTALDCVWLSRRSCCMIVPLFINCLRLALLCIEKRVDCWTLDVLHGSVHCKSKKTRCGFDIPAIRQSLLFGLRWSNLTQCTNSSTPLHTKWVSLDPRMHCREDNVSHRVSI